MVAAPPSPLKFLTGGPVDLALLRDGNLKCLECEKFWCVHLQSAMVNNVDAAAIWSKEDSQDYVDLLDLSIPVFPTANLWTQVLLALREGPVPRYAVTWETPQKETVTVTYINPGEGRNIIRTCLIDYMLGDRNRNAECKASHHSFQQQMRWERDTQRNNRNRYPQFWSVYTEDQCLGCKDNTGMDPDLIPDKQGNNVWS